MPHLLVDISPHGYGHTSQTAAVVNELVQRIPELQITVRTTVPYEFLKSRFQCEFKHVPMAFDFGMKMANAVDVEVETSAVAYQAFHADWEQKVAREAKNIQQLKPDLLLANIPYLTLAAAHTAKIRAVGMCCLNWADIYQHYCGGNAAQQAIHEQMLAAYNSVECFLKVQPAMDMSGLKNLVNIAPIARVGRALRCHIAANSNQSEGEKLVLIAMGGMEFRLPIESWPHIPGIRWIIPQAWGVNREDTTTIESLKLPFTDVLATCDAVITKPGYGMFTEAACNGVPVLYLPRHDWPEEPYLVHWLKKNVACLEVERNKLEKGEIGDLLKQLLMLPSPMRPGATGAIEAATILKKILG